jgi:hypothetical protein
MVIEYGIPYSIIDADRKLGPKLFELRDKFSEVPESGSLN